MRFGTGFTSSKKEEVHCFIGLVLKFSSFLCWMLSRTIYFRIVIAYIDGPEQTNSYNVALGSLF